MIYLMPATLPQLPPHDDLADCQDLEITADQPEDIVLYIDLQSSPTWCEPNVKKLFCP